MENYFVSEASVWSISMEQHTQTHTHTHTPTHTQRGLMKSIIESNLEEILRSYMYINRLEVMKCLVCVCCKKLVRCDITERKKERKIVCVCVCVCVFNLPLSPPLPFTSLSLHPPLSLFPCNIFQTSVCFLFFLLSLFSAVSLSALVDRYRLIALEYQTVESPIFPGVPN